MPTRHRPRRTLRTVAIAAATAALFSTFAPSPAAAQDLQQRIDAVRRQHAAAADGSAQGAAPDASAAEREAAALVQIYARLGLELHNVVIDRLPAEAALDWVRQQTGLPMVIAWAGIEEVGIDPQTPVTVSLDAVPAARLLELILGQLDSAAAAVDPEAALIYDITPWYVHVLTKAQANRRPVLRVYDVTSDVMVIPHFDDPPQMDLGSILSDESGFSVDAPDQEEVVTRDERGQQLAQIIRDTIEPTIWQGNGGQYSSVRYHDGRLIVNAPLYVHRQIGLPVTGSR